GGGPQPGQRVADLVGQVAQGFALGLLAATGLPQVVQMAALVNGDLDQPGPGLALQGGLQDAVAAVQPGPRWLSRQLPAGLAQQFFRRAVGVADAEGLVQQQDRGTQQVEAGRVHRMSYWA